MALLAVKNLQVCCQLKNKRISIVEDINFTLERGQVLGITGESGSGKTVTALSVMNLLEPPLRAEGQIEFGGRNLLQADKSFLRKIRGRRIGMISQEPMNSFNPLRTVYTHFKDALSVHGIDPNPQKIREWLGRVGLPADKDFLRRYPFQLSGGMLQKLMIAVMLALKPDILIADEPTGSLDTLTTGEVIKLLQQQKNMMNLAIIFISHDLSLLKPMADQVLVMYAGRMIEYGQADMVTVNPCHPYTRALMDSKLMLGSNKKIQELSGQSISNIENIHGCSFLPRCDYASPECRNGLPEMVKIKKGHYARCREGYNA